MVKDPRVKTAQRAFDQQFALLRALYAKVSALNEAVNRIRLYKRQLRELAQPLGEGAVARTAKDAGALRDRVTALQAKLEVIEALLVDVKRESPRDVLRHPAGLNDTLFDLISVVAIADEAPTSPALQVSEEIMAKVEAQITQLEVVATGELADLNGALRAAGVQALGAPV